MLGLHLLPEIQALLQAQMLLSTHVSGRRMQQGLQFTLALHALPIVTGHFADGQHVVRADRMCSHCGQGPPADEVQVMHERPLLQPYRQHYAALFTPDTDIMRFLFGQKDDMQVCSFILGCLDVFSI